MDHGSQSKFRLPSVFFARELLCLNRAGSLFNITRQWQDNEILIFCYKSVSRKKIGHMLKPLAPRFRSEQPVRLRDIVEKQVPARLEVLRIFCFMLSLMRHLCDII